MTDEESEDFKNVLESRGYDAPKRLDCVVNETDLDTERLPLDDVEDSGKYPLTLNISDLAYRTFLNLRVILVPTKLIFGG